MQVDIVDIAGIATEATLVAMSVKLPSSLGIKANVASLSVTQSTEDRVVQGAIKTALELIDNAISGANMNVLVSHLHILAFEFIESSVYNVLDAAYTVATSVTSVTVSP